MKVHEDSFQWVRTQAEHPGLLSGQDLLDGIVKKLMTERDWLYVVRFIAEVERLHGLSDASSG